MSRMEIWTTYVLLVTLLVMGGLFVYVAFIYDDIKSENLVVEGNDEVALKKSAYNNQDDKNFSATTTEKVDWRVIYKDTVPVSVGGKIVQASIAETWPDRIKGLSDTPFLPEEVVKLFIFDTVGLHSIWMKDMNYSIDIMWLNEDKEIIYIMEEVSPDSYPESFAPNKEALYVIEAVAGFVQKNEIGLGDVLLMTGDEIPI